MSTDHPVHPAAVHFPISFLSLSFSFDLLCGATTGPGSRYLITTVGPHLVDISRASYYLRVFGLLSAVPAVLTGAQQFLKAYARHGLFEADGKTMRPKMKTAIFHALANDAVIAVTAWEWWRRRTLVVAGAGFVPGTVELVIAGLMLPLFAFAGNLGATLTYNYGWGMSLAKPAKKTQ